MNIVSIIMAVFSAIGALDLITGDHLGLGKEFERGIMLLGTMALSMIGMIVISPLLSQFLFPPLQAAASVIPFDPATIVSSLLANDMGGAQLASQFGLTEQSGYFNGLVVGSMMGATVSFTLPFAMQTVKKEQHESLMLGLMCGIAVIPLGCFVSGLIAGLPFGVLMKSVVPLLIFSALIAVGLWKIPKICIKIFNVFGKALRVVILIGLAVGIFEFLTGWEIVPYTAPIEDGMSVVFNASMVMTGAFPMLALLSKAIDKPLKKLGGKMGINAVSALGFVSTLATNVTTLSMMKDMDDKGVVLNSAFAVSAAFTFAGHLAFTLSYNADFLWSVIVGKLLAGFAALVVAEFVYHAMHKNAPPCATPPLSDPNA